MRDPHRGEPSSPRSQRDKRRRFALRTLAVTSVLLFMLASGHFCTNRSSVMNSTGSYWGTVNSVGGVVQNSKTMTVWSRTKGTEECLPEVFAEVDWDQSWTAQENRNGRMARSTVIGSGFYRTDHGDCFLIHRIYWKAVHGRDNVHHAADRETTRVDVTQLCAPCE